MNEKLITLAKKLHALSERGVGGEKANATAALEAFMKKHGITIEDICGEKKTLRHFDIGRTKKKFFVQLASSVIGHFSYFESKGFLSIELTDAEFIEISTKFEFYWKAYKEDLDIFYNAFIQRNKLYRKRAEDEEDVHTELTAEEKRKLLKTLQMMEGIDERTHHKRIEA